MKNILLVCSYNKWRSPTGEEVWRRTPNVSVRSVGTSPKAKRTVNAKDIQWADLIFAMEQKHKKQLTTEFSSFLKSKNIVVLDIPDEYKYMDEELVDIFKESVSCYLQKEK